MPYYHAGDYYQGDYYQAGGLFGSIGKFIGGVAKTALSISPVGRVAQALIPSFAPGGTQQPGGVTPMIPTPGLKGFGQRLIPGGMTGFQPAGKGWYWSNREQRWKRRRTNVANVHALRRAGRRVKGFLKLARRLGALPVGSSGKKLFKAKRRK